MRVKKIQVVGIGIIVSVTLGGCADVLDGDTSTETLEENAGALFGSTTPTQQALQPYANEVAVPIANLASNELCSGTMLRANVVLTAKHCVTTNGTIGGSIAAANQILVGARKSPNWVNVLKTGNRFLTFAECQTATTCTTSLRITTFSPEDAAWLFLDPTESRSSVDGGIYTPVSAPDQGRVGATSAVAGYGQFFPGNPSDAANALLHFGTVTITNASSPNTVTGGSGNTVKYTGSNGTLLHAGDSGSGIWTSTTNPPGIWALFSGGEGVACTFNDIGGLCDKAQGPRVNIMKATLLAHEDDSTPGLGARDWEFDASSEKKDFELVPANSTAGWTVSSGHLTPWNNAAENMMIAHTALENGCIQTQFGTTDDDTSGLVFRYLNPDNYYWIEAVSGRSFSVNRRVRGVNEQLARTSWTGNFVNRAVLLTCSSNMGVQAWIDPGTANERHIGVVLPGDGFIRGGRLGLYNRFNQAARAFYLRTMSNTQGRAKVNVWVPPCEGPCSITCTQNPGFPPDPEGINACIQQCIASTCSD